MKFAGFSGHVQCETGSDDAIRPGAVQVRHGHEDKVF